ncbi:hypothetical protein C4D60_Mb09t26580 [Musa balbisiana]|uniref:Protein LHCP TRANSLOCATION DEFECT n=1 Tax=Musa balbisiana TaxID=52838 RepID=A0A4S8IK21_MUSBA|nr:hypothetical protein C4D60_Mb09t26580 [Musa balbisiana]
MASIPCSIYLYPSSSLGTTNSSSSSSSSTALRSEERPRSPFLAIRRSLGWLMASRLRAKVGPCDAGSGTATGVDAEGAGIYGSQSRDDFSRYDVEQYFEHMGMLAAEGSYDKMEALLDQKIHPVDILLMAAASEGDKPKMEELLRAGAKYDVRDGEGRTALERAASDEIKQLILQLSVRRL